MAQSDSAFFKGMVKIVAVEYGPAKEHAKPEVTYEIVETEHRSPDFTGETIVTKGGALSSCDYAGQWNVGDVVYEQFYKEGGEIRSSTINMRALDMEKFEKK